jgi:predicted NBD/HSP70 family sugar kinase
MTVGIDLTDAIVRAVRVDDDGNIIARADTTGAPGDIAQAVRKAFQAVRAPEVDRPPTGVATRWPGDPLPDDVIAALKDEAGIAPVTIHCGNASALAEAWCGAAPGCKNLITFSIGEHVTAGALTSGTVLQGARGYATSVAWLALNPVEREDYRRFGGLEAEVAALGIVRRLVWRIKSGDRSGVADQLGGDLSRVTAEHIFDAARSGDGVCISVVRDTAKYVGMAISNLATVLDPECVVLSGTLATSGDMMLDAIRVECSRRLRPAQAERIRIVLSTLGVDAAAIGAARAAALQLR